MRVLNPFGVEIDLHFWAFRRLKRLHLLKRDRGTGRRRICADVFGLMEIWETGDTRTVFNPMPQPIGHVFAQLFGGTCTLCLLCLRCRGS